MMCRAWAGLYAFALLVLLAFSWPVFGQDAQHFFDITLGDLHAELDAARQAKKAGVLLVFEMEGCPTCRRMRENVFNRQDVQGYFREHFITLTVDVLGDVSVRDFKGRQMREKDLAKAYGVTATPTFLFVNLKGEVIGRHVGATRHAREFLKLGRDVLEGATQGKGAKQDPSP